MTFRWLKLGMALAIVIAPALARAQTPPSGYVSVFGDFLPNRDNTAELRTRVFAEEVLDPTPKLLITGSGFFEGLVADRSTRKTDAIFRVQELSVEYRGDRVDLFAGFGTIAWGRLDELQPTDVINPLDVSRFFFEGRSEARLPVGLARLRWNFSEKASIEGVYVPFFRRGRYDQLDEPSSPFNIAEQAKTVMTTLPPYVSSLPFSFVEHEPANTFENSQGGARVNLTTGRVDWSVSAYSGIEPFALYRTALPKPAQAFVAVETVYPRFTMLGGDFETVRGAWGLRGEIAAFVRDSFQSPSLAVIDGSSVDAGVGVDRKAGNYRISGTLLLHHEAYDQAINDEEARTDVSLMLSTDRSFGRDRYQLRGFGVYNPSEASAFLRAIATAKLTDKVAVEGSSGWFAGEGRDIVGRFSDSDFVYLRLKYYF
ncbi:MAG TPA: DUF1302 family protein [Vicinamibacterales bacterium]